MPRAQANGIELEYETFGDPGDPAILLVMGLGIQLLGWDEDFCKMLVERGFFVIRYDNRDVGLSSKMEDAPIPDLFALMAVDASSPGYPGDEDRIRALIAASYDRMNYPIGFMRQLAGIVASPDRTQALGSVRVPTLVIHGEDDPLIQVSGGEATAKAVPGAKLMKIPGMGHDLPPELWPTFVDAIVENAERARAGAQA